MYSVEYGTDTIEQFADAEKAIERAKKLSLNEDTPRVGISYGTMYYGVACNGTFTFSEAYRQA